MSDEQIKLEIGRDEGLVLFELLAEFNDQPALEVPTPAERLALVRLHGELEKTLVEPFQPHYQALLSLARDHLRSQA
jgi:hypothetical protein